MSNSPRLIAEIAFRLHDEKKLSREDLVRILQDCVNVTAIGNGYADVHGLPCPPRRRRRRRGGRRVP